MARLSDNYYLRNCFLDRNQVPTQSVMINKMSPPLARVYFNSMTYKQKVLAGLEPPLKGGGNDWYIPPEEVLDGRLVMQPLRNEYLSKLGFDGIVHVGEGVVARHYSQLEAEKAKALLESDRTWKRTVKACRHQKWDDASNEAAEGNTASIKQAFHEFIIMYTTSFTKIERLLFDSAEKEIHAMRTETFEKMRVQYERLLKRQSTILYDSYTVKLDNENKKLKEKFIKNIEYAHTLMINQIHDINYEKHVIIEKVRQLLESMNLACQVYVALKERDECQKEMNLTQHVHEKAVKTLQDNIAMKDFEIRLALEKEKKRIEFNTVWKKKICAVVKKFQMFATFCLNELPTHADFFTDMEKLMMIQLNEAAENPVAESLFEPEEPSHTPIAKPHPFYLFCDKGYKPQLDQDLCPKHCTSSASQLPVVIVNKRLIYAACDNFEKFTDKITQYIHGKHGDDIDFEDNQIYSNYVPVKIRRSQQLLELKLQSSIMQVLQQEIPNIKKVPTACCVCNIPYCFCSLSEASLKDVSHKEKPKLSKALQTKDPGQTIETRSKELILAREPKWESYMQYVTPLKCKCAKRAKKDLEDHLPAYMRNVSKYDEPCLPNYEKCDLVTLRKLVRQARNISPPPSPPEKVPSKTRDASTQYSNQEFDMLCTCFSDEEIQKFLANLVKGASTSEPRRFKIVDGDVSPSHLAQRATSFADECALSLRYLLDEAPQLREIFRRNDCRFD